MKVMCRLFSSWVLIGALVLHPQSRAFAQDGALPAKPPGVIRIGLVLPRVQMGTNEAAQAAEGVRNMFAEYLNGPTIQVALLSARIPSQFAVEAQQAECDYTLSATVVHRRGNDNAALGRVLGNFSGYIPVGDAVQGAIVSGVIQTASDFASSTQAKDVMQLDYQLQVPGSSKPLLSQSTKSRARTDGEDLLTPLIEQAAEAVGAEISRR
jgi:hypothetical protein